MKEEKMKIQKIDILFVEFIPKKLDEGILYISNEFSTTIHKCACGCGNKVILPIGPLDWKLTQKGKTVTLYPSIGNWSFNCQSHYWIERNKIIWARKWSKKEIEEGRNLDLIERRSFYEGDKSTPETIQSDFITGNKKSSPLKTLWDNIKKRFF